MQDGRVGQVRSLTLVAFVALLVATAGNAQGQASSPSDRERLERFLQHCKEAKTYIDVKFGPVRKLGPNELPKDGTSRYVLTAREYPDNEFDLTRGSVIDFISFLHPPKSEDLPKHLWHVISVPVPESKKTDRITGYVPLTEGLKIEQPPVWEPAERSILKQSLLPEKGVKYFVFLVEKLAEDRRGKIGEQWKKSFRSASDLVIDSYTAYSHDYTHTFIYQDAPQKSDSIRDGGDRRPSKRFVKEGGTAFGFVLDDEGKCLAGTSLKLIRPSERQSARAGS